MNTHTQVRSLTPAAYRRARAHLRAADPVLARVIDAVGPCGLAKVQVGDPFEALVQSIVWQQLSGKAAATIYGRVLALFGDGTCPKPPLWLEMPEERLRGAGLSRAKTSYLLDLAGQVANGTLPLEQLSAMPDEEVIDRLIEVKGIGRWSAQMYLMFRLHRPDVFPIGDLGIVKAIEKLYRLRKPVTRETLERVGEKWRPYRSIASWYLWASLDAKPLKEGEPRAKLTLK